MRFFFEKGIQIQEKNESILIDPNSSKAKGTHTLISHAHSDHYSSGHANALMTPETLCLIQNNRPRFSAGKTVLFKHKTKTGCLHTTFHSSGHVLGSAQILLEGNQTVLVTSDFNPVDSILFQGAEPQPCDTLVIETTFGLPQYRFPDRTQVHEKMGRWIQQHIQQNHFVVLAGYALGKSQELTKICNEFAGITPLVHDKIFSTNQIYEKFGIQLGKSISLSHNLKESQVLIMPPSLMDRNIVPALQYSLHKKVVTAMATGWEYRNGFDTTFPLSDHADYQHLMDFVQACNPKQVYTMHGFASEFARSIQRKLKIPARALGEKNQQSIVEFALQ